MTIQKEMNIAELSDLTGQAYRTIKKRLDGLDPAHRARNSDYYVVRDALPRLYATSEEATLDLTKERARLAKAQADKTELEVKKMEDGLVDEEVWAEEFSRVIVSFKDRLRGMALRLSDGLVGKTTSSEVYEIINRHTTEALEDLADQAQIASDSIED